MFQVPQLSQHLDITDPEWRSRSCGPVCVGMILDYLGKAHPSLDDLVRMANEIGAYKPGIGWYHSGLVRLAEEFETKGATFDWNMETPTSALKNMESLLEKGPLIASVHRNFDTSNGGHLIVLTGMDDNAVTYNEPDSQVRGEIGRTVPIKRFLNGWKRRIIVLNAK
jgi:uncharacterized protein YvpB